MNIKDVAERMGIAWDETLAEVFKDNTPENTPDVTQGEWFAVFRHYPHGRVAVALCDTAAEAMEAALRWRDAYPKVEFSTERVQCIEVYVEGNWQVAECDVVEDLTRAAEKVKEKR